ncbi:MAG: RNA polymerase-binding protein DksA [Deltaproteobacteria bacterium]|nr:RNA polymerase-binding protein DksA [Deltaproteobacteria bacterium]
MSKKKKAYFKKLLTEKMELLTEGVEKSVSGMTDPRDRYSDPIDQASMEMDLDFSLHIKDRETKLIAKIKEALERIDDGTFGICESCGAKISEERLKARPVTTLCIECKKRQESDEKARGL